MEMDDRRIVSELSEIKVILRHSQSDFQRLQRILFGDEGDIDGGHIGDQNKRITKMEKMYIRVTAGIAVWVFITGTGPVTLASIIHLLTGK